MNTMHNHSASLPLGYEASVSMSMADSTLEGNTAGVQPYPNYDEDTTSSDMSVLCSELSMTSLLNIDDVPIAEGSYANTSVPTAGLGWANETTPKDAAVYANSSQFFLHIVESALSQDIPAPDVDNTYSLSCTSESQPGLTAAGLQYVHAAQGSTPNTFSSPCYSSDGYNMEEYIRDMTPEICVDPSLCSPGKGFSPAISAAPSPIHTYHAPFSPVPSLYYSESSPELESPIQSRPLLQPPLALASPTLAPIEEDSVLARTYRAVGATYVPSTSSQLPAAPGASPSTHKTARRSRKTLSSTSRQARRTTSPRPRNLQCQLKPEDRALIYTNGVYRCPVPGCPYVPPASRRRLDVQRHLETHRSEENKEIWVCCGVPVEHAAEYGIVDISEAYDWRGWRMVGGCGDGFSRRDALKRHLENPSNDCVGHSRMAEYLMQLREAGGQA